MVPADQWEALQGELASRRAELEELGEALDEARRGQVMAQKRLDELLKLENSKVVLPLAEVQKLVNFCERSSRFMVAIEHAQGPVDTALVTLFGGLKGEMKQNEALALCSPAAWPNPATASGLQ